MSAVIANYHDECVLRSEGLGLCQVLGSLDTRIRKWGKGQNNGKQGARQEMGRILKRITECTVVASVSYKVSCVLHPQMECRYHRELTSMATQARRAILNGLIDSIVGRGFVVK